MRRNARTFARQTLTRGMIYLICAAGLVGVAGLNRPAWAQQSGAITTTPDANNSNNQLAAPALQQESKAALHQELKALLDENLEINREKKALLDRAEQKTFWIQCLVFFLTAIMIVTLISFWRFHAQRIFRRGMDEITTSLRTFQDSIISFIDTTQLDAAVTVSSFQAQPAPQVVPRLVPEAASPVSEKCPSDFTPPDDVPNTTKGFFDAWLRVYKPGDDYVKQAEAALKNKPQSPDAWLQMIQNFRNTNDYFHFESLRTEIKKFFNIKIDSWSETSTAQPHSIADYPHVQQKIFEAWPGAEIVTVLERLLLNSRLSAREGFDQALYLDLEGLLALAKDPQRPLRAADLKAHPAAAFLFAAPSRVPQETAQTQIQAQTQTSAPLPRKIDKVMPAVAAPTSLPATLPAASPTASPIVNQVPADAAIPTRAQQTPLAASKAERTPDSLLPENKILLSAYEVRLKLALAYLDIGDAEGACLLLEDVINDAPPDQQKYARKLLSEIETKRSKNKEVWVG